MDQDSYDTLLDNLQCPLCCLVMLPPLRSPMIIPECGHTICQTCISKLRECPFCHHSISNPVKNILVLQIIDTLNHQNLIPTFLNPPPPQPNKLIPKIECFCTSAASGTQYISQKSYFCKTCNITGDYCICEVCARTCHNGHDVILCKNSPTSYCDCHDKCQCFKIPSKSFKFRCTFELTYGTPIEQLMYQCKDCHITGDYYICQNCAIKCHHRHNLKYCGIVKGKHCQCLNMSEDCQISFRKPICTFLLTGKKYAPQPWYNCKTCGLVGSYGCCPVCAHHCHKGHEIEYRGVSSGFFCDCGDGYIGKKCQMIENDCLSYLVRCTNFNIEKKDKPIRQRKYNCATCGISGICEACAVNCHINHSIEFVDVDEFCCGCKNTNNCIMLLAPMLHTGRTKCDRVELDKDDISACYVCLRCDKSGKKKICESCALKKHLSHDLHFIGYMKFDCSENERAAKIKPSLFRPKITKI